jgi:hypothetical protein
MKPEYTEGRKATENFEEGMKSLFPKTAVALPQDERTDTVKSH